MMRTFGDTSANTFVTDLSAGSFGNEMKFQPAESNRLVSDFSEDPLKSIPSNAATAEVESSASGQLTVKIYDSWPVVYG